MKIILAAEATGFAESVHAGITRAGGHKLLMSAEGSRDKRVDADALLGGLGVWDLRPRADATELEAAAAVCRVAGSFGLPYPVAERLAGDPARGVGAVAAVGSRPLVNGADLPLEWWAGDLRGQIAPVTSVGEPLGSRLGAFVCPVTLGGWEMSDAVTLSMTLQCWVLLGMLDSALDMTVRYVNERFQFGAPLSSFQALRFRITDAVVAVQGLEELAKYTSWSVRENGAGAFIDVVALRVAAIEAADTVFRITHQLYGALGFCDETALSWLSRHSQPLRRLPFGRAQFEHLLLEECEKTGLTSPYSSDRVAASASQGRK